jgi:predicted RNase H-like HicB family nuclease
MKYPLIIHKDPESDYGVTIPDLHGCFSAGETLEEAIINSQEAILTHIEGLLIDDEPIPSPTPIEELRKVIKDESAVWAIASVDLSELSERVKRINITIPEKILSAIDSFASKAGESRSGLLVHAALEYISHHSFK